MENQFYNSFEKIEYLQLLAKQVVEGFITGLHKSPYHGFSVEFSEHRIYNTGESIKNIDWKLYARTDKLFVKRFEEETNLRCQIIIDNSSSMYFPKGNNNKINFVINCTACLIYLLQKQRDAVGLSIFSDKIEQHLPAKLNNTHIKSLFFELSKINFSENKQTDIAKNIHIIAEMINKRSLIIIFSDLYDISNNNQNNDAIFSSIQHLKHNKNEVILFNVRDKNKEENFEYDNRPTKFVDLESGDFIKLNPYDIKEEYLKKYKDFYNEIKLKCAKYNIDFIDVDINNSIENILIPFLIKRSKNF